MLFSESLFWELGTQKCIKRRNFLRIGALLASNLLVVEKVALAQHSPMLKEKLVIETNGKKFTFSLWDNATTRDLISRLPLTIQFEDLYSREFCYRFPQPLKAEEVNYRGYEVGELIYWPLCMLKMLSNFRCNRSGAWISL